MSNQDGSSSNANRLISAYTKLEEWMKSFRNKTGIEGYRDSIDAIVKNKMNYLVEQHQLYLKSMGRLRNAIVHKYVEEEEKIIAEPIESEVQFYEELVEAITAPQLLVDICSKDPEIWNYDSPLSDALREMKRNDYSQLLIVLDDGSYGHITRDGVSRWLETCVESDGVEIHNATVSDVHLHEDENSCVFVSDGITVFEAFRLFSELTRPIQMLVITSDGTNRCKPIGIVTSFDIVKEVSKLPVRRQ